MQLLGLPYNNIQVELKVLSVVKSISYMSCTGGYRKYTHIERQYENTHTNTGCNVDLGLG